MRWRVRLALLAAIGLSFLAAPGAPDCGPVPLLPEVCVDGCPFEGAAACEGAAVQACEVGADGCLAWRAVELCRPGSACEEGVCVGGRPFPGFCVAESADGHREERDWNEHGALERVRHRYDGALVHQTRYALFYDEAGRETSSTRFIETWECDLLLASYQGTEEAAVPADAGRCELTRVTLDERGRPVRWVLPTGAVWTSTYDAADRLVSEVRGPSCRTHGYDAAGHEVRMEEDTRCDGTVDAVETTTWEGDRRVRLDRDGNADGRLDGWTTWAYDAVGRVVVEESGSRAGLLVRTDSEWAPDGRHVTRRVDHQGHGIVWQKERLDAAGRPVERIERTEPPFGIATTTWTRDLDALGRVREERSVRHRDAPYEAFRTDYSFHGLVQERTWLTWEGPQVVEVRTTTRDVWGRPLQIRWGGGDHSSLETFRYDDQGRLVERLEDGYADGVPERRETHTWSADGHESVLVDLRQEGAPRRVEYRRFDALGRPLLLEYGSAEAPSGRTTWTRAADGERRVETIEQRGEGPLGLDYPIPAGAEGTSLRTEVRVTDAAGRLLTYEKTIGGACSRRSVTTYDDARRTAVTTANCAAPYRVTEQTFDEHGNVVLEVVDDEGDGTPERRTERAFDDRGDLLLLVEDTDADGTPETRTTYDYSCFEP